PGWGCDGSPSACVHVIYVSATATGSGDGHDWANAFSNLGKALAAATAGTEVWVAAGTYKPGATATASFAVPADVPLYGGFEGTGPGIRSRHDWRKYATTLTGDVAGD